MRETHGTRRAFGALRTLVAAFAAGAFAVARAAEPPPVPAPLTAAGANSAASNASIESAKRQFELLKSARDPAWNAKPAMPAISMPDMPAPHSGLPAPLRAAKPEKPEPNAKSANWLVEAMLKPGDGAAAAATEKRDASAAGERTPRDGTREPHAAGEHGEATARDQKEMAGVNPLAPYLAQWMTPQDYALLGTPILRTAEGDVLPGASDGTFTPESPGLGGASAADAARYISAAKPGSVTPAAENPYLLALTAPPVAMPSPTAANVPPTALAISSGSSRAPRVESPSAASAAPKPAAPDLLKAHADEKYFKPLKRF